MARQPDWDDNNHELLYKLLEFFAGSPGQSPGFVGGGGGLGSSWASFADVTVTTPGTAQQLAGFPLSLGVRITANPNNKGNFYIGDSNVNKTGRGGIILSGGGIAIVNVANLNQIWVDADNASPDSISMQAL